MSEIASESSGATKFTLTVAVLGALELTVSDATVGKLLSAPVPTLIG